MGKVMSIQRKYILIAGLSCIATQVLADDAANTEKTAVNTVVVTAEKMDAPLTVVTDAKAPRQPVPAHDGADYLKTISGFNVIRKGGTDGDPVFRGMAGSRLNILLDGEMLLGGCGMRMDPPTAYVFPESYDTITVVKGPQTVLHGPGNSAGTVLFERDNVRRDESGANFNASALAGGFNRRDEMFDVTGGTRDFYVRGTMTNAQQGDYRDGDGEKVHSQYHRYSTNGAVGWTPDDNTLLELTMAESDGEAAYADRSMDGALFERENAGIKYRQKNLSDVLLQLEAQVYYNYVDHVMDNYSLRELTGMMAMPMAMNPDRKTIGARFSTTLALASSTQLTVGIDTQQNEHSIRTTMNQTVTPYESLKRINDAEFEQVGVFAEVKHSFSDEQRLISGLRYDNWKGKDERAVVMVRTGVMMNPIDNLANPSAGETRNDDLGSGFIRYEQDLSIGTVYAGIGRSERFPDYWEIIAKESATTVSAFNIDTEKTNQLDMGYLFTDGKWHAGVSAFYNTMDDFLLIESGVGKDYTYMMTTVQRETTIVRNIDAHSYGLEAELAYAFADHWKADITVAHVRGKNDSDKLYLAQLPPLEARMGINYNDGTWSYGALWRGIAAQNNVAVNQGNIVGQDIGKTAGFGILSFNGGWQATKELLLTAGIDNLLDKTYAEHLSRAGASVSGFDQTTRVNEPGRMAWIKAQVAF
jgi:iron complex outermembrane recepter protein